MTACYQNALVSHSVLYDTPYETFTRWCKQELMPLLGQAADHLQPKKLGLGSTLKKCDDDTPLTQALDNDTLLQHVTANSASSNAMGNILPELQDACPAGCEFKSWTFWVKCLAVLPAQSWRAGEWYQGNSHQHRSCC